MKSARPDAVEQLEATMALVTAHGDLRDARSAVDAAIETIETSLHDSPQGPVQVLLGSLRQLARLLVVRTPELSIQVDLSPEMCDELEAAGGVRSSPACGLVSTVTYTDEDTGFQIIAAERHPEGSAAEEAERQEFAERDARDLRRYGPTGDLVGRVGHTNAAREVYREVRAEQLAHRRERDAEDDRIRALERGGLAALWARLLWSR